MHPIACCYVYLSELFIFNIAILACNLAFHFADGKDLDVKFNKYGMK